MRKLTWAAVAAILLVGAPASAQDERGFIRGLAGVTFGNVQTSSIFAGGGGFNITRNLQIIGEFGRIQDALPNEIADALDDLALLVSLELGVPVTIEGSAPTIYGGGGLRYTFPTRGRIHPFVEGMAGVASVKLTIKAEVLGIEESESESQTEALLALGGGIAIGISDGVGLDIGYRYHAITTDDMIHVSSAFAGLRIIFR